MPCFVEPPCPVGLQKAASHTGTEASPQADATQGGGRLAGRVRGADSYSVHFRPVGAQGLTSFTATALPFCTARVLKAQVRNHCTPITGVPDDRIRLLYRGVELPNDGPISRHMPEASLGATVDLQFLVLGWANPDADGCAQAAVPGFSLCEGVPCPEELLRTVGSCSDALRLGASSPTLCYGGTGGVYFLGEPVDGRTVAVFKPKDEEAGAPQNPHGWQGCENTRGMRPGVPSAQRAAREVAGYMLDHGGFVGVPMTTLVRGCHSMFVPVDVGGDKRVVWKVGAFQEIVNTKEVADNFGPSMYDVTDIHRIGTLDVRVANFDRNGGNLLVKRGSNSMRLVPIDHGCTLPDRLAICQEDVIWMGWPQAKLPFDEETLRYIAALDPQADAAMLARSLGLERCGLRVMEVTTRWLQAAASRGLALFEIGEALYRNDETPNVQSAVELVVEACLEATVRSTVQQKAGSLTRTVTYEQGTCIRRDVGGALFACTDAKGRPVAWSALVEAAFARHVGPALDELAAGRLAAARARLPPPPPPERAANRQAIAGKADEVPCCLLQGEEAEDACDCAPLERTQAAAPTGVVNGGAEGARLHVPEASPPGGGRPRYVPPHVQRRMAQAAADAQGKSGQGAAAAGTPAVLPARSGGGHTPQARGHMEDDDDAPLQRASPAVRLPRIGPCG